MLKKNFNIPLLRIGWKFLRVHKKVWLLYNSWFAMQYQGGRYFSLGIHLDWDKFYIDFHFWKFIISIGNNPVLTPERDRHRGSCRGFLFPDDPIL